MWLEPSPSSPFADCVTHNNPDDWKDRDEQVSGCISANGGAADRTDGCWSHSWLQHAAGLATGGIVGTGSEGIVGTGSEGIVGTGIEGLVSEECAYELWRGKSSLVSVGASRSKFARARGCYCTYSQEAEHEVDCNGGQENVSQVPYVAGFFASPGCIVALISRKLLVVAGVSTACDDIEKPQHHHAAAGKKGPPDEVHNSRLGKQVGAG
jgi:hypothetical protein